jgi:hypothetical protein
MSEPQGQKKISLFFALGNLQKGFQQAFSVLQPWFTILRYPALPWSQDQMREVMYAYGIIHNMIIERRE